MLKFQDENMPTGFTIFGVKLFIIFIVFVPNVFAAAPSQNFPSGIRPGDGYAGRLEAYDSSPDLRARMARFDLSAGWFYRDKIDEDLYFLDPRWCPANELPYLLYTPKDARKPVPMVVYFGGTGEHGTNLVEQFRQTTIFAKLTSPEFQKRNPCYVFAPMFPKGASASSGLPEHPNPMLDLVCDTMFAIIKETKGPPVDRKRIYATGLSFGGGAAYSLLCAYPGRFAAAIPVSCTVSAFILPKKQPVNYWLLYNENGYRHPAMQNLLTNTAHVVRERGGDFRSSSFPDAGHNAWDKAWSEDVVWEWLFSKTSDGSPIAAASSGSPAARPASPKPSAGRYLEGAICAASIPGAEGHEPAHGADNLEATWYASAEPAKRGDWWMVEFPEPVSGRVVISSGTNAGKGRLSSGRVESSSDGKFWNRCGSFSSATGECRFTQRGPAKFFRVLPEHTRPETLILREVNVE